MGLLDKFTQQMQQKIRAAFSNDGKIDEKEARELGLSKEKAKLLMRELAGDGSGILSSDSVEITAQNSWVGSPSRDTHQDETAIQAQGYTAITDRMSIPLGDGYEFQVKMYYNENTDNYRYIVGMYKDGSRMDGTGFENEQKLDNYLLTKYGVNYAKLKVGNYLNFNKDTLEFSLNISPVDSKKDVTIDAVEGGFEIPEGENFQKTNRRFAVAMIRDMYNSVIKENLDAVKSLGALDMGFWREALGMGVQAVADLVEGQELITATTLKRVDRMVQERDKVCGVLEQLVDNPSEFSDKFSQLVGKAYSDMNFQKLRDICHNGKTPNEEFELRHTKCMEEFDKMYSDNKITNYLEGNTGAKIFGSISQKADAVADIIAMFWATGGIGALWGKAGQKTAQMLSKEILKDAAKGNYKNVVAKFSKLTGSVKQRVVQLAENNPKLAEYMSRAANSKFGKYSALASANFVKGAPTSVATMSTWEGMKTFLNCITNAEELPMSEILEQTWESIKGGAEMGVEMTGLQAFAINPIMTSKLMSKALSKMTGASKQAKKLVSESGETGVSMQEISKIYEECALTRRGVFVNEGAHLTVTIGTMVPAFAALDTAFGYDEESYKQQLLQTASSQQERDEISKMSSAELRTKFFIDNLEAQAEGMTTIEGVSLAMRRWQAARLAGHKMKRKQINIVDANLRSRTEDGKTFYELTGADGKVLKLKEGKRVVSKFSSIASATAAYNTLCMQVFANLNAENELEEVVVTGVNGVNEAAEATSSFAQREKVSVRTDEGVEVNDRAAGQVSPDKGATVGKLGETQQSAVIERLNDGFIVKIGEKTYQAKTIKEATSIVREKAPAGAEVIMPAIQTELLAPSPKFAETPQSFRDIISRRAKDFKKLISEKDDNTFYQKVMDIFTEEMGIEGIAPKLVLGTHENARSAYTSADNTITIFTNNFPSGRAMGVGIIAHELKHFLQFKEMLKTPEIGFQGVIEANVADIMRSNPNITKEQAEKAVWSWYTDAEGEIKPHILDILLHEGYPENEINDMYGKLAQKYAQNEAHYVTKTESYNIDGTLKSYETQTVEAEAYEVSDAVATEFNRKIFGKNESVQTRESKLAETRQTADNNTSGMAMSTILPLPSSRLINHAKQTIQRWFGGEKETVGQVSPDKGVAGGKLGETKQTPYISAGNKVFDIKPEDFAKNPAKIKEVQASIDELRKTEPRRADELQIVFDMFKNPTKDYDVSDAQLNAVARFIHEQYAAAKDELNSTVKFNELDSDGTFSSRIKSEASLKVKLENYLKDAIKDRQEDPEKPIKTLYDAYIDVRDAYACRTEFKSAAKGTYTDPAKIQALKNEISQLEQQNADKKIITLKEQELERRENIIKLVNEAKQLRAEGKTELAESKMLDASRIAAEIQSQPYVEKIKAMLDRIKEEYGDVEVLRLTNYTSKEGISILSREQLCEIKQYGADKGVRVDFIKLASDIHPDATSEFVKGSSTKQQPTGYMAIQVNFRTKSGMVFEHQFRGQLTGKLAESEHPLYDLRTGKCPWKLHPELEGLYKPIGELIDESVMPEGAYKNHQRYLMDYNTHLRKLELGFDSEAPRMEEYELYTDEKGVEKRFKFDKRLSAENLIKLDDVAKEVTAKRIVPEKAVAEFYRRIGAKELEDGMLDINLEEPIKTGENEVVNNNLETIDYVDLLKKNSKKIKNIIENNPELKNDKWLQENIDDILRTCINAHGSIYGWNFVEKLQNTRDVVKSVATHPLLPKHRLSVLETILKSPQILKCLEHGCELHNLLSRISNSQEAENVIAGIEIFNKKYSNSVNCLKHVEDVVLNHLSSRQDKEILMNLIANYDFISDYQYLGNIRRSRQIALLDKLVKDKNFSNENVLAIIDNTYDYNVDIANKLCADVNFPKERIADILKSIRPWNKETADIMLSDKNFTINDIKNILLCQEGGGQFVNFAHNLVVNYKQLGIYANQISMLVSNQGFVSIDNVARLNKILGKEKVEKLDQNELKVLSSSVDILGKKSIDDLSKTQMRILLETILVNKGAIEGGKLRNIDKHLLPFFPTSTVEYKKVILSLTQELNIKNDKYSSTKIDDFYNNIDSLVNVLYNTTENIGKIELNFSQKEFVGDVNRLLKSLPKEEQIKIQKLFGFKIIDGNLTGYPNTDAAIDSYNVSDKTILVRMQLLVEKYINQNSVSAKASPNLSDALNNIINDCPEILNLANSHDMLSKSVEQLQKIVKNTEFKNLSTSDKRILVLATLLNNLDMNVNTKTDTAFDAYNICTRLNMNDADARKLLTIIEFSDAPERFMNTTKNETIVQRAQLLIGQQRHDTFDYIALKLRTGNLFQMTKMLYSTKYIDGFTRNFDKKLQSKINEYKSNDFTLLQTTKETIDEAAHEEIQQRGDRQYRVKVAYLSSIPKFYALTHSIEFGAATGGSLEANYVNFKILSAPYSEKVVCASLISNANTALVDEFKNVLIISSDNNSQFVAMNNDIGSQSKTQQDLIIEYFRKEKGNKHQKYKNNERAYVSKCIKEELYGKYYTKIFNVDKMYAERYDNIISQLHGEPMSIEKLRNIDLEFAQAFERFLASDKTLFNTVYNEALVTPSGIIGIATKNIKELPEFYLQKAEQDDLTIVICQ